MARVATLPREAVLLVPRLLLLAVPQKFEQPEYVLVPYEYCKTAKMASTPHLSRPPLDPPDPVGVFGGHFHRLPPNGEHLLVPSTPDPLSLYPSGNASGLTT